MTNKEKYNFSDFTHRHYSELIDLAKENYIFRNYENFKEDEKFIIWRHDIDFSVHEALHLAKIEHEKNVTSTFFLHIHNEFYNLLEKSISEKIHEIISLGHAVGIHFDTHYYNIESENELIDKLNLEKQVLEGMFGAKVKAFSFHNTTPYILGFDEPTYAGLINTYSSFFKNTAGYCSDSNGYWIHRRLYEVLSKHEDKCLQVLTHPVWWTREIMSPKEKVLRCVQKRAENNLNWYDNALKKFGRENIDW